MRYYLAVDIGASSGRHILGHIEDGRIRLEEIHRFTNTLIPKDDELCWDLDALFAEIMTGMKKCAALGKIPESIGIDTWGVDFVLLDRDGHVLGNTVGYRDKRTNGMDDEVFACVPESELYARTGIQRQIFNTIFQLMAVKKDSARLLERADCMLLVPDYLHYLLCGQRKTEYTIATTTGLVGADSKNWDFDVIDRCGFPRHIFQEIIPAGTVSGRLSDKVAREAGFSCDVMAPPSHDTASAFLAIPVGKHESVYISSGTWSLMGVENQRPVTTEQARLSGFTNEGGYKYRYRFLKNIMGLWTVQSVRRETGADMSFSELMQQAMASDYQGTVDINKDCFLSPDSMIAAVKNECLSSGLPVPDGVGDVLKCIYDSLAQSYADTVKNLEQLTGVTYGSINIIGGGSKDTYLNRLTAKATGRPVYAGPVEGTSLGNIISQMINGGGLEDIEAARKTIRDSFEITEVLPDHEI